ncbi:uncharacterized protein LOC6559966 isoform X2 [Drosophila grimshawi]|uniref:GH20453 n=2 Tax=Drosophila grimshawi TaxID=7222 RepID=B4J9G1_DROGR|nr:uncharacterized protein LOC6559966 isoform X2 [Drosophila grimshawi]EDW01442.1 GH20453 [Drosophila grimshawi]
MLAGINAASTFAAEYERCELTANETQLDLSIDETLERQQIEMGSRTLCGNFELCAELDDHFEYIECMKNSGSQNMDIIVEINHNATSAHTRLREDIDSVQQTLVLCTLEAQVAYESSMRLAFEELQVCRSQADDYPR